MPNDLQAYRFLSYFGEESEPTLSHQDRSAFPLASSLSSQGLSAEWLSVTYSPLPRRCQSSPSQHAPRRQAAFHDCGLSPHGWSAVS